LRREAFFKVFVNGAEESLTPNSGSLFSAQPFSKLEMVTPRSRMPLAGPASRCTDARDNRRGIPQGSPISPLLANLYMRRFVLGWKKLGLERSLGSRIVAYADDLVILCTLAL
jgi:hypothetical protein